jgi:hypothetical protein
MDEFVPVPFTSLHFFRGCGAYSDESIRCSHLFSKTFTTRCGLRPLARIHTTRTPATMRSPLNWLRSKKEVDKTSKYEQESLEYLSRITRHDSKKEKKTKLKYSFERNKVRMVRALLLVDVYPVYDGRSVLKRFLFFLQQKVTSGDILKEKDAAEGDSDDMAEGVLLITRSTEQSATVPNCCIICLESYKPGDTVVWASNEECQHAFHRKCVVKYLVKIQKKVGATPCPCCRQRFTDLEVEEKKKKRRFRFGYGF